MNLNFVTYHGSNHKFYLKICIQILEKNYIYFSLILRNTRINHIISDFIDGEFQYKTLEADFNLNNYLNGKIENLDMLQNVSISVLVFDIYSKKKLSKKIILKIKSLENKQYKKYSALCSKAVFLDSLLDVNKIKWWNKLNQLNFHKIDYFSIRKKSFRFENILKIRKLNCFPNLNKLSNKSRKFLDTFEENTPKSVLYGKIDLINELLINECYLNNIDKYEYIGSYDSDELIITRKHIDFTFETYKAFNQKNNFSLFIPNYSLGYNNNIKSTENDFKIYYEKVLVKSFSNTNSKSTFFRGEFLISNNLTNNICIYLNKNIKNLDRIKFEKSQFSFNISEFTINYNLRIPNREAYFYFKHFCRLFEEQIKPSIRKYEFLEKKLDNFFRFSFFKFDSGGKSIHRTDKIFNLITHFGQREIKRRFSAKKTDIKFLPREEIDFVDYKQAYLSHFRRDYSIMCKSQLDIRNLGIDLNYLYYFKSYATSQNLI